MLPTWILAAGCTHIRVPDPDVRYIAFGDSSTAGLNGWGYPRMLCELLREPPRTFANEGRPGESSRRGLARLHALLSQASYPNAKVLLYWQGGQDITDFIRRRDPFLLHSPDEPDYRFSADPSKVLDETQANVESAIAAGRSAGLNAYVATYYPLCEGVRRCPALPLGFILPLQVQRANTYIARLNERMRQAAANQGAILVDISAAAESIRADPRNYVDCNHLSERGNRIVAQIFFDAITPSRP
jgi:lysophospholipase L1-like esterase